MPVPSAITDLSQTPASNYPAGSESPITADDYFRAHAAFIAALRDGKGFTDMVTLASGATTDIGGQNALAVEISGTTTITSFGTTYNGPRFLRFTGALTLTHNSTTLNLPGGVNVTTAAGDTCIAMPNSSANGWVVTQYQKGNTSPGVFNEARGSVTMHATTMDLWAQPNIIDGTGSAVTITAIANAPQAGARRVLYPIAGTIITNGATFAVDGAANYTTAAGDALEFEAVTTSTYKVHITKKDGTAVVSSGGKLVQVVSSAVTRATGTTTIPSDDTIPTNTEGTEVWSLAITPASVSNKVKVNGSINISGTASMYVALALFRGSTCLWAAEKQIANPVETFPVAINLLDPPATTSATTYSIRVGAIDGGGSWCVSDALTDRFGGVAATSTIELMEIAP